MTGLVNIEQVPRRLASWLLAWTVKISWTLAMVAWLLGPSAARADFTENFDTVTPPTLPSGWTATNASGPDPVWVTTAIDSDSQPGNAFVDDPGVTSDKWLDSPSIPIATITATLTFRHSFNLEIFDGGVLEISIGGEPFQDIVAAGGSFAAGQYNGAVAIGPLGGRSVWNGNSGGYITTKVNLPILASGRNIVLRFRMGSDSVNAGVGWHIDSIEIDSQDRDSDLVTDAFDNCPDTANPGQENTDGEGRGDACDNCPNDANLDQSDADSDGIGDVCDNCPIISNADQADADGDGIGDVCNCGECGAGITTMLPLTMFMLAVARSRRRRRACRIDLLQGR